MSNTFVTWWDQESNLQRYTHSGLEATCTRKSQTIISHLSHDEITVNCEDSNYLQGPEHQKNTAINSMISDLSYDNGKDLLVYLGLDYNFSLIKSNSLKNCSVAHPQGPIHEKKHTAIKHCYHFSPLLWHSPRALSSLCMNSNIIMLQVLVHQYYYEWLSHLKGTQDLIRLPRQEDSYMHLDCSVT